MKVFISFFRFLLLFFIFILASCSNSSQDSQIYEELYTLRQEADQLNLSTQWTEELEGKRLSADVSKVSGISPRLNLTPLILTGAVQKDEDKIFPSLVNFGSLDTSLIDDDLRKMLDSFSKTLCKNENASSFMNKSSLFTLALYYIDFEKLFDQAYDFKAIKASIQKKKDDAQKAREELEEKIKAQKEEEDKNDGSGDSKKDENNGAKEANLSLNNDSSPQEEFSYDYFDSFIFGQPFIDGIYYDVPIRFYGKNAAMTLNVYCFLDKTNWKIDQIRIADWEIFNGKQ